jgi:hypothetical protein
MKKISSDTVEKFELTLEKLSMLFKKSLLISFQSDVIHCHYRNNIVFHWIQYRKKIFILRLKAILKKKFEEKLQGCRKRCLFNFTFDIILWSCDYILLSWYYLLGSCDYQHSIYSINTIIHMQGMEGWLNARHQQINDIMETMLSFYFCLLQ